MLADLLRAGLRFFRTNSPLEKGGGAAGAGVVLRGRKAKGTQAALPVKRKQPWVGFPVEVCQSRARAKLLDQLAIAFVLVGFLDVLLGNLLGALRVVVGIHSFLILA